MPTPYRLLYRIGHTPWDGVAAPAPLLDLLAELPPGRALDIGCGTGMHSRLLAESGWQVTGVDLIGRALETAARRTPAELADRIDYVRGDATKLGAVLPSVVFDLVLDVGCFHGLGEGSRERYLRSLAPFTGAGSVLFLMATQPRKGIGPHGMDAHDARRYAGADWRLDDVVEHAEVAGASVLKGAVFSWYRFHRV